MGDLRSDHNKLLIAERHDPESAAFSPKPRALHPAKRQFGHCARHVVCRRIDFAIDRIHQITWVGNSGST